MDLDIRQFLCKAKKHQDPEALHVAFRLIRDATTSGRSPCFTPELCVVVAETALQLGCLEISAACLKMYFEGNPPANQFLCRAYLCQGQLKSPPATGTVADFEEAVMYFLKAIEISKQEPRNHFMVFNASVLYFQTVRPLLQPGRCLHLVPSFKQVVQSLEEVADQDHSWRAELMMHLVKCLVDSGESEEAARFCKVTEEFMKSHAPHLYPRLFTLQVQHQLCESDALLQTSGQCATLTVIYKIQDLKITLERINEDKLTKEDSAKLEEIFYLLVECTKAPATPVNPSLMPIQPSDRVAFLLELALLALQVKHQKVAADCLKELKSAGEASIGQRIIMECVNCEINLLKREAKMNDYSKASVEVRLKEIGKMDQWLQAAVREGGPEAVQAVCATQWSFCLPLLQHNLRKHTRTALLRVAQALEDMQSTLLEMRCEVHSELAVIEEEEGRLEAALTHLQKALLLDNKRTQRERLSSALHLLQLRQSLYQTPSRVEDKAAVLIQQARDVQPNDKMDSRPILVAAGLLLAPDDFQMVLDADNTSKSSAGSGPVAQLVAKAQHHTTAAQKVEGHLARQGSDTDSAERVKLWAALAKTARKQEVWDVCRAACRFCLLYDDGRWKISKTDTCRCSGKESCPDCRRGNNRDQICIHLLRLLAEIHFINAEATVQKLLTEGVQLNSPAVRPQERGECVHEEDPHWAVYRDWIQALSAYATSSFLRAGELGVELAEPWVAANAATYLWNYNSHLLAAGEYQQLLPAFQSLVDMLQKTDWSGNRALFVLLCDAVARGLIQPLCGPDSAEPAPAVDRSRSRAEKGMEKPASVHGVFLDPAALQDVRRALELCELALRTSNCSIPKEAVHIAARKQALATWVQIKRLLQQQIGSNMDMLKDECENEEVFAMTRVLVAVEMFLCNKSPRHMEFSVPGLSTLVSMASECSWTDAVVELQVWCQLAAFCHHVKDHSLVLRCTESALQLEEAATKSLSTAPCVLYGPTAVNEMLSSAACLRGLSLLHESSGDPNIYSKAMKMLLSSVSFAEKADSPALCATAARHYWNACQPLTQSLEERWQLQEHLEKILHALVHTTKHGNKQGKRKGSLKVTALSTEDSKHRATTEEDLTLRAAIYSLLLHLHTDKLDFKGALGLLDAAMRDMPRTRHRLPLLKARILLRARLGESVELDMQKLEEEDGKCCSSMWHQVALCAHTVTQQQTCYQKAISSFTSAETEWQKVDILLEFGGWLYSHSFPRTDALQQVQAAVDLLLSVEPGQEEEKEGLSSVKCESPLGVQGVLFTQSVSHLKEVRRLDCLIQAHTLLAVMTDKASPEHQIDLLRASSFVLQMWQVSMAAACEISSEVTKSQSAQPPPSAGSRKGKDKGKGKKGKDSTPAEERPKPLLLDQSLPATLKEWARFVCPDQARQIFRTNSSSNCINANSIVKQAQSLFYLDLLDKQLHSLSLDHLTLPVLHLAETIAHDLMDRRSLSDLYRLRMVRTCAQLGLETLSPYQEKLLTLSRIQEQEQMRCHKDIIKEGRGLHRAHNQTEVREQPVCRRLHAQDIWLDKAEVCLSMGLYQSARQLLAEAHLVATELRDQTAMSRSLLSLASLACEEQNYGQAVILLDKAQALGGDEDFWYQLTLTRVTAAVSQTLRDSQTKVDQIIKEGCAALRLALEQRVNRAPDVTFFIISLEKRGAVECVQALGGGEPGHTVSTAAVRRLMAACDTLRECAAGFTKLGCREQAAEAHRDLARGLRILASHVTHREKRRRLLLDGLCEMQRAVSEQEHVVLNAQSLLHPQEESHGVSLAAMRRLLRLQLALAEFILAMLEEHCAEETRQALDWERKTSAERALEEFTHCTPEPNTTEQEWLSVSSTLGQMASCQLDTVSSHSMDNPETRARCLSLTGKYLRLQAAQEEPIHPCALWDGRKQKEACCKPKAVSTEEEENSEKDSESSRKELRMTSAKSAELQKKPGVQQLLTKASKALTEATSLCLQHNLPSSILADASVNMLECHGQADPAVAGQYLSLFQSCCAAATMAEVLSSACADTGESQLAALLSIRRNLLLSEEERSSSILKGAEDSLSSLSKAFSHLSIAPNHLSILSELPSNLKILLLQHSEDGSELYGAFYKANKGPENQKGKTTQVPGTLVCSKVAKVSVCPRALWALRERTQAFGLQARQDFLKEDSRHGVEGRLKASEDQSASCFRQIVHDMEDYLNPLLDQFDLSCLRPQAAALTAPKNKDKEEKGGSVAAEPGEDVLILADRKLMELPLEDLSIFQEDGLSSVSRDFSLQLFYSRLNRDEPQKVESDNKKETKGGRGTKGKADQSQAIKAIPANHVLPSNTLPVDTRNFKYIISSNNEGHSGPGLSTRLKESLESHSPHLSHLWESFSQTPSLSEVEEMLCRCSAFVYVGTEGFMENIPPGKLPALNLSDCRLALLFDRVQSSRGPTQSNPDVQRSAPQKAVDTALLLSLSGVGCVVLSQWHSSLHYNIHNMAAFLHNMLKVRQTSGQTVQALRKGDSSEVTGSHDEEPTGLKEDGALHRSSPPTPPACSCILYGLPNLIAT